MTSSNHYEVSNLSVCVPLLILQFGSTHSMRGNPVVFFLGKKLRVVPTPLCYLNQSLAQLCLQFFLSHAGKGALSILHNLPNKLPVNHLEKRSQTICKYVGGVHSYHTDGRIEQDRASVVSEYTLFTFHEESMCGCQDAAGIVMATIQSIRDFSVAICLLI